MTKRCALCPRTRPVLTIVQHKCWLCYEHYLAISPYMAKALSKYNLQGDLERLKEDLKSLLWLKEYKDDHTTIE